MENTDIPQFHTYRGEIEFEGTLIQADIFIDNKMLEDKNSFLISFLCKSNTIYKMVCRSVLKKEGYYINLKFNGVKLKKRVLSVSQSFIDSNSEIYRIGLATVYKGNIIKNLIMDCQSYTKYRPNETTGGIFVSWRRKEELPTGA